MVSLAELSVGQQARVLHLARAGVENKLYNLGIREGMVIKKVTGSSNHHGPVVIKAGRTQVALGQGMASKVMVEPL